MTIAEAIARLAAGGHFNRAEAKAVFDIIMAGAAPPATIAAVLMGLRRNGETVDEITGAAEAMRAVSTKVDVDLPYLVDTCGTGGSGAAKRFNISTAAAFVASAAGANVAKHGNRAASSKSGSADVLEAAGVNLALDPAQVARCIREVGVGFLFAMKHHGAMRHAAPVRRELGMRTIFNLLGPLTNPVGTRRQVLGVFSSEWLEPLAQVALALGGEQVLVVHCDGLDELSIHAPTQICEAADGEVIRYDVSPSDFRLAERDVNGLVADSPAASLALMEAALGGRDRAAADIVAINAGAAIYAAGVSTSLANGVATAQDVLASGQAREKFAEFVAFTRMLGEL